jgi:hypothetical protein
MTLVCENHRNKAWPDECDCGPGMLKAHAEREARGPAGYPAHLHWPPLGAVEWEIFRRVTEHDA